MLLLLLFCASVSSYSLFGEFKKLEARVINELTGYSENCTFTRQSAVDCIARYVDTNHDDIVTIAEVDTARERYMGFVLRALQKVVSWEIDVSTPKIMQDCGADEKGEFTEESFLHGKASHTCLPSQQALCMFEVACKYAAHVYSDEQAKKAKKPRVSSWWN